MPFHVFRESDCPSLDALLGKTVAILGYGNQGRAQALCLRDSGVTVCVGNRDDAYGATAVEDGFERLSISEAAARADVLFVLTTDESQPLIWDEQIRPQLRAGQTLVWASGYNVGFGVLQVPSDVDVLLVAPRMMGSVVRELYVAGSGAMAEVGVHQVGCWGCAGCGVGPVRGPWFGGETQPGLATHHE